MTSWRAWSSAADRLSMALRRVAVPNGATLEKGDPPMANLAPLRRRMIEDMTIRNLWPATQQSYVDAVAKFSRFARPTNLTLKTYAPSRCI